jgi:hypothetical protein
MNFLGSIVDYWKSFCFGEEFLLTLNFPLLRHPAATTSNSGHIKPPSILV